MPIRIRKLLGAFALIALVVLWALTAMAVAQFPVVKANGFLETIYYVLAGLGWVLPAMPLIRWMSRGERRRIGDGPLGKPFRRPLRRIDLAEAVPDRGRRAGE